MTPDQKKLFFKVLDATRPFSSYEDDEPLIEEMFQQIEKNPFVDIYKWYEEESYPKWKANRDIIDKRFKKHF